MSSISSESEQQQEEEERWDDWIEEAQPAVSLFDSTSFPSATAALDHDKVIHGVDLALLCSTLGKLTGVLCFGKVVVS